MNRAELPPVQTEGLRRKILHRWTFRAAGVYNLLWGAWTSLAPGWLFAFAGMDPPRYPEVFACLGMVIGLYGLLYLWLATDLERIWPVGAVGLIGKVLGPMGFAYLLGSGLWPPRAAVLILFNDLIWWLPFGLYLLDRYRLGRR